MGVLYLKMTMSTKIYRAPGNVANAAGYISISSWLSPQTVVKAPLLTTQKERRRVQRPILGFEPLHQRRQTNEVEKHVHESRVY